MENCSVLAIMRKSLTNSSTFSAAANSNGLAASSDCNIPPIFGLLDMSRQTLVQVSRDRSAENGIRPHTWMQLNGGKGWRRCIIRESGGPGFLRTHVTGDK